MAKFRFGDIRGVFGGAGTDLTSPFVVVLFPLILFLVALLYWPALEGGFLLDDFAHLPRLQVVGYPSFFEFIFSQNETPGRFLSYASFLIDDHAWPSQAWSFKYTNLMFHLVNGVLVFVLSRQLFRCFSDKVDPELAALVVMLLWLVHPLQISTVMYVIQRMTILSTTMVLIGLTLYIRGRSILSARPVIGYFLVSFSVCVVGSVGFCFKESSVNLLVYVALVESFFLSQKYPVKTKCFHAWKALIVFIPLLLAAFYLFTYTVFFRDSIPRDDFTVVQRLLTQSRVVADYIQQILVPNISHISLYHDNYPISKSLFSPVTTFLFVFLHLVIITVAMLMRGRYSVFSFSVLWFYGGHILESTTLPLELYFEHRNYLPLFGLVIGLTYAVFRSANNSFYMFRYVGATYCLALVVLSFVNAHKWADSESLKNEWLESNPRSARARIERIDQYLSRSQVELARGEFEKLKLYSPEKVAFDLMEILKIGCGSGDMINISNRQLERFTNAGLDHGAVSLIDKLTVYVITGRCPGLEKKDLVHLVNVFLENPNYQQFGKGMSFLYRSLAKIYASQRNLEKTILSLDQAYNQFPFYDYRLQQALLLSSAGLYDLAQEYIDLAKIGGLPNKLAFFYRDYQVSRVQEVVDRMRNNGLPAG